MEKVIEFTNLEYLHIDIEDYTSFIGFAPDGISYPYISFEIEKGYKCGRCMGGCPHDQPDEIKAFLHVWEENEETKKTI